MADLISSHWDAKVNPRLVWRIIVSDLMQRLQRRTFVQMAASFAVPPLLFADEKSKLRIVSVRLVNPVARHPLPAYTPSAAAWSTNGVEVASPMSIYPDYKAMRSLFMPNPGKLPGFYVEIATDKGIKGFGQGGPAGGPLIEDHFAKLLVGKDPFDISATGTSSGARA